MTITISRLYNDYSTAAKVVAELKAAGLRESEISIIANNAENWYSGDQKRATKPNSGRVDRDLDGTDDRVEGAATGAGVGAGIGSAVGLLAGLGLIAIPGIGPVVAAGWLVSTLAGTATGAATGGIVGALSQAGMNDEDAHVYAEGVRRGGTLVIARVPEADRSRFDAILDRSAVDIRQTGTSFRQSGWSRFDSSAAPYTADQVRMSRQGAGSASLGATRTITAFFDKRDDANAAIQRLVTAGVQRSQISMLEGSQGSSVSKASNQEDTGFWDALKDFFLPDEDRHTYSEGLRRGGFLLTVRTNHSLYDRAVAILDDEGTVDLDQRMTTWRKEGWQPQAVGTGMRSPSAEQEVIPVTEEQLKVGKRDVSHGRVRVRTYVVEEPVQERVDLREERVRVERRPVDRPATVDERLFQNRTIEAEERAEEAVVEKQARVKEELTVRKDVDQRSKTVSDKVRRTEVKVEDERTKESPSERRR
jgi:uncharacterized protein (TIGR02271 family)